MGIFDVFSNMFLERALDREAEMILAWKRHKQSQDVARERRSRMTEDEARVWLLANGWEARPASLYDEEGVEGWGWSHPAHAEEYYAIGLWDDPPAVAGTPWEIAEAATPTAPGGEKETT